MKVVADEGKEVHKTISKERNTVSTSDDWDFPTGTKVAASTIAVDWCLPPL